MQHDDDEAAVQMAPLIDCVFNLLIFFLVTSLLLKPHKEIAISVPDSGIASIEQKAPEPLVIVVTASNPEDMGRRSKQVRSDPFIIMEGDLMTKDLLERRLRQISQQTPNRQIRIDSDPELRWRYLVPILDLCRFHGLANVDVRID